MAKPLHLSRGKPAGPRWLKLRAILIRGWAGQGRPCFYCGHGFLSPDLIEVCHRISPILDAGRAWDRTNLVPGHGSGRRRCPEPSCNLACNYVAAIAPDMMKNSDGEDMPFTEEFKARQALSWRNSPKNSGQIRRNSAAIIPEPGPSRQGPGPSAGRDW